MRNKILHILLVKLALLLTLSVYAVDPEFKIVTSKTNTIYVGIDNLVEIPGYNPDDLLLKGNNGMIFRDSIYFDVVPRKLPQIDLVLYQVVFKDTLELKKMRLPVEYVPDACIRFADTCLSSYDWIPKEYFSKYNGLSFFISDDIIGANNWSEIVRIDIGYSLGRIYKSFKAKGGNFTKEMREKIARLPSGTILSIKVSIRSESAIIKKLPVYKVRLK